MKKANPQSGKETQLSKKVYSTPQLANYGNVTQVTRGGSKGVSDGMSGSSKPCWIAEVLYGVDAPRTRLVRAWLIDSYERHDPIVCIALPLYSRFGMAVAGLLQKHPILKPLFRLLFDRAVKSAHKIYAGRAVLLQS